MEKFRVGVIGYGWASTAHIQAINGTGLAEVRAVYSSRELDGAELSERYGSGIATHSSLEHMLGSDIDAVSICSYPDKHVEQALAAAEAGKHLIIEKPLALDPLGLKKVEEAVEKAGVKVCVCFECRYASQFLATKAVIDEGLLGELHYGEVDYYHGIGPWYGQFRWNTRKDAGGSSLLSAGCHAIDALLLCMGGEVESVSSYSTGSRNKDFAAYEYDTTSVTIVKFTDGRVGKVTSCIDCLQPYYFHTHLIGSEGSLLDNKFHSTKLGGPHGLDKSRWSELAMKLLDSGDVSDHPYQTQFEAFFEAIAEGRDMPLTNFAEAVRTHRIIFAADRSAVEGRPVSPAEIGS